ncbi:hypothetical protein [Leifsonia poae]|uniref:hypothetical protein n=1 Tax=Leifsonia poae TaxID=110933 RepID=UPI003D6785DF
MDYTTWIPGLHSMRNAVLDAVTDEDLAFSPGRDALTWAALLGQAIATQRDYLRSFTRGVMVWSEPIPPASLAMARRLFDAQDDELVAILTSSHFDPKAPIDRPDLTRTANEQIEAYVQFMLMFLAQATVYLRAQGRPVPPSVAANIG